MGKPIEILIQDVCFDNFTQKMIKLVWKKIHEPKLYFIQLLFSVRGNQIVHPSVILLLVIMVWYLIDSKKNNGIT